ncbi:MAG TPA: glycosyltransferase family 2 protein [Lachnospiraceae bacterium]|nr:glycosyltransferase family 2 protein [Lachnospiraceae bacterium]
MKDRILLFIPAYNCEKQIIRVLGQLDRDIMKYIERVIVTDNRSTDSTGEVVSSFIKMHGDLPVVLLRNRENYGLGGSHKVAFQYAIDGGFDYVMVLHGDDQGFIHDFIPVLSHKIYRKHDAVLGARFMRESRLKGYSALRTFGNIVYDFLFAFVVRKKIYDLGSGLNIYSVESLKSGYYMKFPDNLMFNYAMILASEYYAQDICFYPISWREDDQASNVKLVSQAVKVLRMLFGYYHDPLTITQDYRDKRIDRYEAEEVIMSRMLMEPDGTG